MDNKNMHQKTAAVRSPYIAPKLLSYGAVRDLTTGGSKGGKEINPPNGIKTRKA